MLGGQHQVMGRFGAVTLGEPDGQHAVVRLGYGQHDQVSPGQVPDLPGQRGQHFIRIGAREQAGDNLGVSRQPGLLLTGHVVEPGIVDRDAGRAGQGNEDGLVVLGELTAALFVGQVQVPVNLIADAHGYAEKGLHRRMTGWES